MPSQLALELRSGRHKPTHKVAQSANENSRRHLPKRKPITDFGESERSSKQCRVGHSSANRLRGFLSLRNERAISQGLADFVEVGSGFGYQLR